MIWTPERIAELTFIARDVYTESPVIKELCDALEAQQAELEAARAVVEAARAFRKTPYGYPYDNLLNKLNTYDRNAARARQGAE